MNEKKKLQKYIKLLRDTGEKQIMERINMIKNEENNFSNDILTKILESCSKNT